MYLIHLCLSYVNERLLHVYSSKVKAASALFKFSNTSKALATLSKICNLCLFTVLHMQICRLNNMQSLYFCLNVCAVVAVQLSHILMQRLLLNFCVVTVYVCVPSLFVKL